MIPFLIIIATIEADDSLLSRSLIKNGGFEETRDIDLTGGYFLKPVKDGVRFSGRFIGEIPANFDQISGKTKRLAIVEGEAGREVHSGKRAFRADGGFFLRDQFDARTGETLYIRFFVRGKGNARFILFLMNSANQYFSQGVPNTVKVNSPGRWVKVVHKIKITAPDCHRSKVRYEGTGDLTIDDLVVLKWDEGLKVDARGAVNESSLQ